MKAITAEEWRKNNLDSSGKPLSSIQRASNSQDENKKQDRHNRGASFKRPDLGGIYLRSKWEANYVRWMNLMIERGEGGIVRWEYEIQEFEFPIKRGNRYYKPDFKVYFADGTYEWHEVKGWMDAKSKTKLKRFKQFFPDEERRLRLITGQEIGKIETIYSNLIPTWER